MSLILMNQIHLTFMADEGLSRREFAVLRRLIHGPDLVRGLRHFWRMHRRRHPILRKVRCVISS